MERRRLGRTGLEVSVLGYGAGAVGGLFTKGDGKDQERAVARAIEAGVNYFDTAALYGNGESERNLGRVLKALKADIVLGTKFRLAAEHRADVAGFVARSLEESLARLGRDHVDLFQLHNPLAAQDSGDRLAVEIALNEVVPALDRLRSAGKIRFIGFSGVGEPAALRRAVESKLFDTVQVVYNALNPSAGGPLPAGTPGLDYDRLLERAQAAGMGTIVIRALAGGALTGSAERHALAMQQVPPIGSAPTFADDVARARQLVPLLDRAGAASLTELGERFVISHPAVSTMLIGYSTLDHLEAAIGAVGKGPLAGGVLARIAPPEAA